MPFDYQQLCTNTRTLLVAEIGINQLATLEDTQQIIKEAAQSGADAVKFQSFSAAGLVSPLCLQNGHWVTNPAYQFLEHVALPLSWHQPLQSYATELGLLFFFTPFEPERLELAGRMQLPIIKVASGDITYYPLLTEIAAQDKPIFLATGGANLGEVEKAVQILTHQGNDQLVLLHCVSTYPSAYQDANVRALITLKQAFGFPVGYSDHSPGDLVPLAAVSCGAKVIEKHFTIDKTLSGGDHAISLNPAEFKAMAQKIRYLESALGNGVKQATAAEYPQLTGARRGIYAKCDIPEGTKISNNNTKLVRHNLGIGAQELDKVLGRTIKRLIPANHAIFWSDL